MHSLRYIHWYPPHPQYVKDSQIITPGRPSGARWGPVANQDSLAASQKFSITAVPGLRPNQPGLRPMHPYGPFEHRNPYLNAKGSQITRRALVAGDP